MRVLVVTLLAVALGFAAGRATTAPVRVGASTFRSLPLPCRDVPPSPAAVVHNFLAPDREAAGDELLHVVARGGTAVLVEGVDRAEDDELRARVRRVTYEAAGDAWAMAACAAAERTWPGR